MKAMSRSQAVVWVRKRGAVPVGSIAQAMGFEYDQFIVDEVPVWIKLGFRFCMGEGRCYLHMWDPNTWWEEVQRWVGEKGKKASLLKTHPSTLHALSKREYPEVWEEDQLPKGRTPREKGPSVYDVRRKEQAKKILRHLKKYGARTAIEIAQAVQMNYTTLLNVLDRLVEKDYIIRERGKAEGRGRPAYMYRLSERLDRGR